MKTTVIIISGLSITGLLVLFLCGPRYPIDLQLRPVELPPDLDGYLQASEARFTDIIAGTEKKIVWADSARKSKTPLSIIYLHGFSATRQETAPLCETLARILHANLFYTRLTGHGRSGRALGNATLNDWANDALEALAIGRRIGERVVVVATSTGATLATWMATVDHSDDILAWIMLSPNYGPKNLAAEALTWPWAEVFVPILIGETRTWKPANDRHGRYWTTSYPTRSLLPMMGLVRLVREAHLEQINQPLLVIMSPRDQVVDAGKIRAQFQRVGSEVKKLVRIDNPGDPNRHVIAGDILSPASTERVAKEILDFVIPLIF